MTFETVTPDQAHKNLLNNKDSMLIDVREGMEYHNEKPQLAIHTPLSSFGEYISTIKSAHTIYVLCKSGNRAQKAGQQLLAQGITHFKIISGGLDAWKTMDLPTDKGTQKLWSLERQVRFTAGLLVTLGIVLTLTGVPKAIFLPLIIGTGLIFSALTNTCGMGLLLTKMPWNQK